MTGIQMLLKQVGLDPEKVQSVFDQFTNQFPAYLNAVGQKVQSVDERLARLEVENRLCLLILVAIAEKLEVQTPHVVTEHAAITGPVNGHAANSSGGN